MLIEKDGKKLLVVGDMHVGYRNRGEAMDIIVNRELFEGFVKDFDAVFSEVGGVDKLILLGDVKHGLSAMAAEERYGLINLMDYLERKTKEIIIVRGNHDNYLGGG